MGILINRQRGVPVILQISALLQLGGLVVRLRVDGSVELSEKVTSGDLDARRQALVATDRSAKKKHHSGLHLRVIMMGALVAPGVPVILSLVAIAPRVG